MLPPKSYAALYWVRPLPIFQINHYVAVHVCELEDMQTQFPSLALPRTFSGGYVALSSAPLSLLNH
jgi:hypothetical protein